MKSIGLERSRCAGRHLTRTAWTSLAWSSGCGVYMVSVRLPQFLPSRNGLHFPNSWPSEPNYTLSLLGQKVTLGNASNGLCGGMAYTVADLYLKRRLPPPDTVNPAAGTPLFNY